MRAWILSGGGCRGALQVGLMQGLFKDQLLPDLVCGVSVGALNGFFAAQHKLDELERLWRQIKAPEDVFRRRLLAAPLMWLGWQWGYPSLYKPGKLASLIKRTVKHMRKGDFKADLRIGTVDLISGEHRVVNQTHPALASFIAGSMAVPLAFPPVKIRDKKFGGIYVDGCIRNLTPLRDAIRGGADELHVMLTNRTRMPKTKVSYRHYEQIIGRTIDISLHEILIQDIKNTLLRNRLSGYRKVDLVVYEPSHDCVLPGLLDFTEQGISDAIAAGEAAYQKPLRNDDLMELFSMRPIENVWS